MSAHLPALDSVVQLGVQVAPAVHVENTSVGGGSAVERDLSAHLAGSILELAFGTAGHDQTRIDGGEIGAGPRPEIARPASTSAS
jgi:hypothetical protein